MSVQIYEAWREGPRRMTEVHQDEELLHIRHTQDVRPIIASAKQLAGAFDPYAKRDVVHVARIPLVMWQRLVRLGIARDPQAFRAWLNSPEARDLRTDDGRKL